MWLPYRSENNILIEKVFGKTGILQSSSWCWTMYQTVNNCQFLKGCIWKIKLNKQFFTEQREIVACLLTVLVFLRNLNGYQPLTRVPVASVLWIPPASTMATASFTRYIPKTWGHKLANISFLPGKGRKMSYVIFQEILTEISFSILSSCTHSEMF